MFQVEHLDTSMYVKIQTAIGRKMQPFKFIIGTQYKFIFALFQKVPNILLCFLKWNNTLVM